MADLHIQGLHKYYGQNHVVKGIDLVIPSGEFTVLVGQYQRSLVQRFEPIHQHLMAQIPGIQAMRDKFK